MREVKGKRVLVTGGAGFIGSHLVDRLLAEGAERVVAVDNLFLGKLENLRESLGDPERAILYREDAGDLFAVSAIVERERVEVVFNLATKALLYSFLNPAGAFSVNPKIAEALLELLRRNAYESLVHCSSSEVFGTARLVPMTEEHPLMPETSYAAGKAAADLMVRSYHTMFGLDLRIVRPFNNYGPRQNEGQLAAIIPLTLDRIFSGRSPVVEGDGLQTRDFIFVSDTVQALIDAYRTPAMRGQEINVGSGQEVSIRELVELICRETEYTGPIEYRPERRADVRRHCAGTARARELLGFAPRVPLEEGIRRTVAWYRAQRGRA